MVTGVHLFTLCSCVVQLFFLFHVCPSFRMCFFFLIVNIFLPICLFPYLLISSLLWKVCPCFTLDNLEFLIYIAFVCLFVAALIWQWLRSLREMFILVLYYNSNDLERYPWLPRILVLHRLSASPAPQSRPITSTFW